MRPETMSPAHHTGHLAELVCSNSLKATRVDSAAGLLKASLVCTVVIPVLLYAYTLVYRNLQNGRPREEEEGGTEDPGNTQT